MCDIFYTAAQLASVNLNIACVLIITRSKDIIPGYYNFGQRKQYTPGNCSKTKKKIQSTSCLTYMLTLPFNVYFELHNSIKVKWN